MLESHVAECRPSDYRKPGELRLGRQEADGVQLCRVTDADEIRGQVLAVYQHLG